MTAWRRSAWISPPPPSPPWGSLLFSAIRGDGQHETEARLRAAIEAGDTAAWLGSGGLLSSQPGREREAEQAYRRAIDTGDADLAPRAANRLASLVEQQADLAAVRAAYQRAIDSGHADEAPWALVGLG